MPKNSKTLIKSCRTECYAFECCGKCFKFTTEKARDKYQIRHLRLNHDGKKIKISNIETLKRTYDTQKTVYQNVTIDSNIHYQNST